jgi:hypothetical protein
MQGLHGRLRRLLLLLQGRDALVLAHRPPTPSARRFASMSRMALPTSSNQSGATNGHHIFVFKLPLFNMQNVIGGH